MLVQKYFPGIPWNFGEWFSGMIGKSQDFLEKFRTELGATENKSARQR